MRASAALVAVRGLSTRISPITCTGRGDSTKMRSAGRIASSTSWVTRTAMTAPSATNVAQHQIGSDLLLVQAVFLQRYHPSAEQVDTSPAVHRSFEGLQFIDLSFGLTVAPRFQHSVPNSPQVLAYRPRKTLHRVDAGRACVEQPSIQPLRRSTAKQVSKPHRQMPHRGELRRRRLQRIDVGDLPSGHLATGFDAKRRRGQRRDRTTGHRIQCSHADRYWLLLLDDRLMLGVRLARIPAVNGAATGSGFACRAAPKPGLLHSRCNQ